MGRHSEGNLQHGTGPQPICNFLRMQRKLGNTYIIKSNSQ